MTIKQLRAALENNLSASLALASNAPVGYPNTDVIPSKNFMDNLDKQIQTLTTLKISLSQSNQKVA